LIAASNILRQLVTFGWRRSSARRSRSVIPPHTPNSILLSRASARHSYLTGQPRQMRLATFCSAPSTNSASGSPFRHAARLGQSATSAMCEPPPPLRPGRPCPLPPGASCRARRRPYAGLARPCLAAPSCSVVVRLRNVVTEIRKIGHPTQLAPSDGERGLTT